MAMNFELPQNLSFTEQAKIDQINQAPGFGVHFTDHMALIEWDVDQGWHDARITEYAPLPVNPAGAIFHYAQEIFEGLKAYRRSDGSVWMFREAKNAARFRSSAKRLALPELPEEDFIEACHQLVKVDEAWVPNQTEQSLYLRPFMVANEDFLGVRPAQSALFAVIASPVGGYFSAGVRPVDIWVEKELSRVANGGTGSAKCGGNYAASLLAEVIAKRNGCSQVLFLDNCNRRWIEELGGMNFFVVTKSKKLLTPNLNGNILPGVTRDSILSLAGGLGLEPIEGPIDINDLYAQMDSGEVSELFACGTAAVVTPIRALKDELGEHKPAEFSDEYTLKIRNLLLDIQYGKVEAPAGWTTQIVEAS